MDDDLSHELRANEPPTTPYERYALLIGWFVVIASMSLVVFYAAT